MRGTILVIAIYGMLFSAQISRAQDDTKKAEDVKNAAEQKPRILVDSEPKRPLTDRHESSTNWTFALWAFFVIALLCAFLYFLKKLLWKGTRYNGGNVLTVISKRTLSPNVDLFVVRACGKYILIGATKMSVNKISDLTLAEDDKNGAEEFDKNLKEMMDEKEDGKIPDDNSEQMSNISTSGIQSIRDMVKKWRESNI